jgi:hypothetical protein
MDGESHGLTSDLSGVEAGYAWGSIDGAVDISNAFETQHKVVDCKNNNYTKVVIDGNEILTKGGVQGNDNPKDADGGNPALTLLPAVGGAVVQIDAKKDGWVYIVAKLSVNKNYVVFEEGTPIGYKIAMEVKEDRYPTNVINLEIKGSGEYNYVTFENHPDGILQIGQETVGEKDIKVNGLGVFYFPVAKDCKYLAHATGSKISWSGVYFAEKEATTVAVANDEGAVLAIVGDQAASVKNIKNDVQNNVLYNIAGQKVDNNYKGLVIMNGKKVMK